MLTRSTGRRGFYASLMRCGRFFTQPLWCDIRCARRLRAVYVSGCNSLSILNAAIPFFLAVPAVGTSRGRPGHVRQSFLRHRARRRRGGQRTGFAAGCPFEPASARSRGSGRFWRRHRLDHHSVGRSGAAALACPAVDAWSAELSALCGRHADRLLAGVRHSPAWWKDQRASTAIPFSPWPGPGNRRKLRHSKNRSFDERVAKRAFAEALSCDALSVGPIARLWRLYDAPSQSIWKI